MAELIDVTIPGQKKSYPLKDVTIIGRASTTDIKFDDLIVSRHHARICRSASGYLIEDLGSQNGVFLGSERITSPHPLTNGEKICIGPYTLIFKDTESGQPYPSEFPSTEYTQIIMATKDPLPIETMDEKIGRETEDKGEFEPFQKRLKIFHDIT
ncbi:MAG: acetoacetate metabolism regulatory protein AtoC, partial [Candidatus Brocadiaceae bacterium]|nr:acetoacetate metabolism regulatory protein AtoC [Candidatus Brocadiaceae bacterium]